VNALKLTEDELNLIRSIGRQYPKFLEILGRWRQHEMERMVQTPAEKVGIMQGRVHALTELQRALTGQV
jgi:hypothetical protein